MSQPTKPLHMSGLQSFRLGKNHGLLYVATHQFGQLNMALELVYPRAPLYRGTGRRSTFDHRAARREEIAEAYGIDRPENESRVALQFTRGVIHGAANYICDPDPDGRGLQECLSIISAWLWEQSDGGHFIKPDGNITTSMTDPIDARKNEFWDEEHTLHRLRHWSERREYLDELGGRS